MWQASFFPDVCVSPAAIICHLQLFVSSICEASLKIKSAKGTTSGMQFQMLWMSHFTDPDSLSPQADRPAGVIRGECDPMGCTCKC